MAGEGGRMRLVSGLLWTGLAILLLAAGWSLLPACGLRFVDGRALVVACAQPAAAARASRVAEEAERQRRLQDELRRLERQIAALPNCSPVEVTEPPVLAEEPEVRALPDEEAEAIPEEAWEREKLDFLEGCWRLVSDYSLRDVATGQVTTVDSWEVCFDRDGRGRQTLAMSDGHVCEAPVQASFPGGGRLRLSDLDDIACPDGRRIFARITDCERTGRRHADCLARQPGRDTESPVRFER